MQSEISRQTIEYEELKIKLTTELEESKLRAFMAEKALAAANEQIHLLQWVQKRCEDLEKGAARWRQERDVIVSKHEEKRIELVMKHKAELSTTFDEMNKHIERLTEENSSLVAEL